MFYQYYLNSSDNTRVLLKLNIENLIITSITEERSKIN